MSFFNISQNLPEILWMQYQAAAAAASAFARAPGVLSVSLATSLTFSRELVLGHAQGLACTLMSLLLDASPYAHVPGPVVSLNLLKLGELCAPNIAQNNAK